MRTDLDCYQQARKVTLHATGLKPGGAYAVALDGRPLGSGHVAEDGTVGGTFSSGRLPKGVLEKAFTLAVTDGDSIAQRRFRVTRFTAGFSPSSATPTSRVRFSAFGFGYVARIYVHYVGPSGKVGGTAFLGRGRGPCGKIPTTQPRALFPFRPRSGLWRLQFDTKRTYDPKAVPRLVRPLRVRTTR